MLFCCRSYNRCRYINNAKDVTAAKFVVKE